MLTLDPNLARNPVARGLAVARLRSTTCTALIRLHLLEEGEPMQDLLHPLAQSLAVLERGLALDGHEQHPDALRVQEALEAAVDLARGGWLWRRRCLALLDDGMERVRVLYPTLSLKAVAGAWRAVAEASARAAKAVPA